MMRPVYLLPLLLLPILLTAQSPAPQAGPVIDGYGAVYDVPHPDLSVDTGRIYRVVFDISESPGPPSELNPNLNTVARFLNMHVRAGAPLNHLRVACVLHGGAAKDALEDSAYRDRFLCNNPNSELLRLLSQAGVDIYLCGQSAAHRGFHHSDLAAPVKMALSAMTVLVTLGGEGYTVVSW